MYVLADGQRECREGVGSEIELHQEPITRSLQLRHIPVTAFSHTDLFLV